MGNKILPNPDVHLQPHSQFSYFILYDITYELSPYKSCLSAFCPGLYSYTLLLHSHILQIFFKLASFQLACLFFPFNTEIGVHSIVHSVLWSLFSRQQLSLVIRDYFGERVGKAMNCVFSHIPTQKSKAVCSI